MTLLIATWIKFFVLFAPFFVVSMFLSLTRGDTAAERRSTANKAVFAAALASLVLFFFGSPLFELLGITIDSFRIGAGILLFLSAISLVRDGIRTNAQVPGGPREDASVVPLAIPTIIGPATIGAILVYGSELHGVEVILGLSGMFLALICLLALAQFSPYWRSHPYLAITLVIATLVVPAYVNTLLAQSRRANEAEHAANQAKSQFLAQASHDLRQPIHAMGLLIGGIDRKFHPPNPANGKPWIFRAMVSNANDRFPVSNIQRLFCGNEPEPN